MIGNAGVVHQPVHDGQAVQNICHGGKVTEIDAVCLDVRALLRQTVQVRLRLADAVDLGAGGRQAFGEMAANA